MLNQEEQLRSFIQSPVQQKAALTVLQLKISEIDPSLRKDQTLHAIMENFDEALTVYGRAFCLKNDDIFVVYSTKVKENEIKALLIRTWMSFSGTSQIDVTEDELTRKYTLPEDRDALSHEISRISAGIGYTDRPDEEYYSPAPKEYKPQMPVLQNNQSLLTPEILARITKALSSTDFSNMMRRQFVCIVLEDILPQPMFEEVFVSIADLGDSILPDVSLTATPWLFQDLSETLDKRVLSSVSRHDDGAFMRDFSLNLNVSTILSDDFRNFDENIRSSAKNSIVLELQPVDIFSDLTSYLMARDYAQNLGYKICIDGVTSKMLRFIDRERLRADFIKLVWSNDLSETIESDSELKDKLLAIGANRAILCRVDDEEALRVAQKYNITLFQGHYIQYLMSQNVRNRRVGTTMLRR